MQNFENILIVNPYLNPLIYKLPKYFIYLCAIWFKLPRVRISIRGARNRNYIFCSGILFYVAAKMKNNLDIRIVKQKDFLKMAFQ